MAMFLEPLIGIDQTILFTMELATGNERQSSQCMMSLVIGYFRVSEYPGQSWKCPLLLMSKEFCELLPQRLFIPGQFVGLNLDRYSGRFVALTSRFTHGDTRIAGTRRPY